MVTDELGHLLQLAEKVRLQVASLRDATAGAIPEGLESLLEAFSAATRAQEFLAAAGEMARSLATLIAHDEGGIPDEQTRHQIASMIQSLLGALDSEGSVPHAQTRQPLVTPIPLSEERHNRLVALYLDSGAMQGMLQQVLEQDGYSTINVNSLSDLLFVNDANVPVAIIADLGLCALDVASEAIFAGLRQRCKVPPHLFCVANSTDISARLDAVRLGATRFFSKPLDTVRLLAVLKGVTAQTVTHPFRAMLIEDDLLLGESYRVALNKAGVETMLVHDPLLAPQLIRDFVPDVVVSDIYMPGCNGLELLAILRQDDSLLDTPILFLSSENDIGCRLEALNLGGDDFLTKPVNLPIFVATIIARAKRARSLKRSRSEYRRILARLGELERAIAGNPANSPESEFQVNALFTEQIFLDDFAVGDLGPGSRPH
jgi:DNA-binding response OmpR family regulator